MSEIAHQLPDM